MTQDSNPAAESAMRKLDQWFQTLSADEQAVIADLVRAAALGVAERLAPADDDTAGFTGTYPVFLGGLTPTTTPSLREALLTRQIGDASDMYRLKRLL